MKDFKKGRMVIPIPRLCFGQCDSCGFRCIKLIYGNSLMILFRMSKDANCDFKLLASNKKMITLRLKEYQVILKIAKYCKVVITNSAYTSSSFILSCLL